MRFNYTEVRELFEINKFIGGGIPEGFEGFYPVAYSLDNFIG